VERASRFGRWQNLIPVTCTYRTQRDAHLRIPEQGTRVTQASSAAHGRYREFRRHAQGRRPRQATTDGGQLATVCLQPCALTRSPVCGGRAADQEVVRVLPPKALLPHHAGVGRSPLDVLIWLNRGGCGSSWVGG
jgi:hypothetical protein